jgi:TusE/DsrC/DsvC family sulfur relay protein
MSLLDAIMDGKGGAPQDPKFPYAPHGWTSGEALKTAEQEGLKIGEEHWEAVRALQEYFAKHADKPVNLRELHDALDEKFHDKGGIKHLYRLFPNGPVAQGCRLAGLKVPAGATSGGFGSVM